MNHRVNWSQRRRSPTETRSQLRMNVPGSYRYVRACSRVVCRMTMVLWVASFQTDRLLSETKLVETQPRAIHPVEPTIVTFLGSDLIVGEDLDATRVACSTRAHLQILPESKPDRLAVRVAPYGLPKNNLVAFQVFTPRGISEPILACVDSFPTSRGSKEDLSLPTAIDGKTEHLKELKYSISLRAGQVLAAEIVASRMGSALDAMLTVRDETGQEVGYSDDSVETGADPRLEFEAARDGRFHVFVRDVQYRGNLPFRLRLCDYRLASGVFPPGVNLEASPATAGSSNRNNGVFRMGTDECGGIRTIFDERQNGFLMEAGHVVASRLRQFSANATNVPVQLSLPCGLNGRFTSKVEQHQFEFDVAEHETLEIQSYSQQLGLPTFPRMAIQDANGQVVAKSDPGKKDDPFIRFASKQTGKMVLTVSESHRNFGTQFGYHITVHRSPASFELYLDGKNHYRQLTFPGGIIRFPIKCNRFGYNGPIALRMSNPGNFVTLETVGIPEEKSDTQVLLHVAKFSPASTLCRIGIDGSCFVDGSRITKRMKVASQLPNHLKRLPRLPDSITDSVSVGIVPAFFELFVSKNVIQIPIGSTAQLPFEINFVNPQKHDVDLTLIHLPAECKLDKPLKTNQSSSSHFTIAATNKASPGISRIQVECVTNYNGFRIVTRSRPIELELISKNNASENDQENSK